MRKLNISKIGSVDSIEISNLIAKAELKKISRTKEGALFLRFKNGDNTVIEKLLDSYEWLITNIAKRYINKGKTIEELMSIGKAGLQRQIEVDKEISRTDRFGAWWIESSIKNSFLNK